MVRDARDGASPTHDRLAMDFRGHVPAAGDERDGGVWVFVAVALD